MVVHHSAKESNWPPESVPPRLYRYMSAQRAESILAESKLYFCAPSSFNDPFDCQIRPSFYGSKELYRRIAFRLATDRSPGLSRNARRGMVRNVREKTNPRFFEEIFEKWQHEFLNKSGMLCMTEKRDDILMWSHYADGHRGVCLEFEYAIGKGFFGQALPIRYLSHFPQLNFAKTFGSRRATQRADFLLEFGNTIFLSKASQWSYEKEWRLIEFAMEGFNKFGLRSFPPEALKGVILGCQVLEGTRNRISKLVTSRSTPTSLYRAVPSSGQFGLEVEPLETL